MLVALFAQGESINLWRRQRNRIAFSGSTYANSLTQPLAHVCSANSISVVVQSLLTGMA